MLDLTLCGSNERFQCVVGSLYDVLDSHQFPSYVSFTLSPTLKQVHASVFF